MERKSIVIMKADRPMSRNEIKHTADRMEEKAREAGASVSAVVLSGADWQIEVLDYRRLKGKLTLVERIKLLFTG